MFNEGVILFYVDYIVALEVVGKVYLTENKFLVSLFRDELFWREFGFLIKGR